MLCQQKILLRRGEDRWIDKAIACSMAEFGSAFAACEPQHFMPRFLSRVLTPGSVPACSLLGVASDDERRMLLRLS